MKRRLNRKHKQWIKYIWKARYGSDLSLLSNLDMSDFDMKKDRIFLAELYELWQNKRILDIDLVDILDIIFM